MVPGGFDLEVRAAANGGAECDEQLGEDRDRVRLGVRRDPVNDLAGQLVIDGTVWRCRPSSRRRQPVIIGRRLGGLV